jgi:hypothetical protein
VNQLRSSIGLAPGGSEVADEPRVAKRRKLTRKTRPQRGDKQYGRSRVSNGRHLFITGPATSAASRRFADILAEVVSDLGGPDQLSEGQRQLARRGAALSLACERLEAMLCGAPSAIEEKFKEHAGGLSPYAIIGECSRLLHATARVKGGDGARYLAELPAAELDRVVDLLTKAGDLAAKAIAAGSEMGADLELYGTLADRCGRTFQRLGLRRQPREVESLESYLEKRARELPPEEAEEAADMSSGLCRIAGADLNALRSFLGRMRRTVRATRERRRDRQSRRDGRHRPRETADAAQRGRDVDL